MTRRPISERLCKRSGASNGSAQTLLPGHSAGGSSTLGDFMRNILFELLLHDPELFRQDVAQLLGRDAVNKHHAPEVFVARCAVKELIALVVHEILPLKFPWAVPQADLAPLEDMPVERKL